MANNNKSIIHSSKDFRMTQKNKSQTRTSPLLMPKPSLIYPTKSSRSNYLQQNFRYLYVDHPPNSSSHRTISARIPLLKTSSSQKQQSILSRPHHQYGHFLAYLRRQSLARLRRKQEEEDGEIGHIETTITLNLNKQSSTQTFQSASYYSLASVTTDTSSIPMISMTAKRTGRSSSLPRRPLQRSTANDHLKKSRAISPLIPKQSVDDHLYISSSVLVTPRNSVVDELTMPPIIIPCESYLNNDNEMNYQRQILSTSI